MILHTSEKYRALVSSKLVRAVGVRLESQIRSELMFYHELRAVEQ